MVVGVGRDGNEKMIFDYKGNLEEEWNNYIFGLHQGGIQLLEQDDSIVWFWNVKNGEVNCWQGFWVSELRSVLVAAQAHLTPRKAISMRWVKY